MKRKKQQLNNLGRWTLFITTAFFGVLFLYVAGCFVKIAVTGQTRGTDLYEFALEKYLVEEVVTGRRGTLYDRDGNALAEQLTSYTLYANLYEEYGDVVEDIDETAEKLSTVIDLSKEEIVEILSKDAYQVEFGTAGRQLTYLEKEKIDQLGLSGIGFRQNTKRFYPNGIFASHTLGYTKLNEETNVLKGEMGLELYLDEYLAGKDGVIQYIKDKKGYLQPNKKEYVIQQVKHGYDFYLTLDSTIQTFLEEAMNKVWEQANPESLVAVVANPKTGEILAMGSRSSFDPNIRDIENYNNPVVSEPFEPGSTMKIYTYAAAINEGKYSGSQFYESGSRLVNGSTIRDYNTTWGTITYDEGFYRSSNTAIIDMLTNWISPDKYIEYLEAFGFGSQVGLPLPSESAGTLPTDWDLTQKMTAGFGHGILTTPIQHIQAISAILNGGQIIKPQLISQVYDSNTEEMIYEFKAELGETPITAQTAEQVKQLMVGVTSNKTGSGRLAYSLNGFTSGGKTGTAQIADGANGYLANEYLYSYIGFAPAEDPELVMYVAMKRPETGGHDQLGQIYRFVMQNSLVYLGAEKTPVVDIADVYQNTEVPQIINESIEEAVLKIEEAGLTPIIIGDGTQIFAQSPKAMSSVSLGSKVFIQTSKTYALPNFTGWTKDEVVQFAMLTGLQVEYMGEGYVLEQSIQQGQLLTNPIGITLTLTKDLTQINEKLNLQEVQIQPEDLTTESKDEGSQ
ncbi:MAG: penicillin-binding protein [Turicibacter sp.]|nr:penicillin-binding protein [Turicibacter sp.]